MNVASRMESTDEAGKVRLSEAVYRQLEEEFELEPRGLIEIKGKGQMPTWFLVGQKALLPRPGTLISRSHPVSCRARTAISLDK